jgi:hypothetical protein
MLSLRSFHVLIILAAIVLAAGCGAWALVHHQLLFGVIAFALGGLLVVYWASFMTRRENTRTH